MPHDLAAIITLILGLSALLLHGLAEAAFDAVIGYIGTFALDR